MYVVCMKTTPCWASGLRTNMMMGYVNLSLHFFNLHFPGLFLRHGAKHNLSQLSARGKGRDYVSKWNESGGISVRTWDACMCVAVA